MATCDSSGTYNRRYYLGSRDSEWIRVLASQLVLIHHLNPWATQLLEPQFMKLLDYLGGNCSVGWFWVYSGYVFDTVYNKSSTRASPMFSAGTFTLKRIRRLYPLHIITLAVILWVNVLTNVQFQFLHSWKSIVLNILLLQNVFGGGSENSINPVMWSVSLELVAYAAFFCWVRYLRGDRVYAIIILISTLIICRVFGLSQNPINAVCLFFGGTVISSIYQGGKTMSQVITLLGGSLAAIVIGYKFSSLGPIFTIGTVSLFIASGYWIKSNTLVQMLADRTYTLYVTHTLVIWCIVSLNFSDIQCASYLYFLGSWLLSMGVDSRYIQKLSSHNIRVWKILQRNDSPL